MSNVTEYRERIVALVAQAKDAKGNLRFTDEEARQLAAELSDEDLAFGMDFNTPEEVAQMLVESGL